MQRWLLKCLLPGILFMFFMGSVSAAERYLISDDNKLILFPYFMGFVSEEFKKQSFQSKLRLDEYIYIYRPNNEEDNNDEVIKQGNPIDIGVLQAKLKQEYDQKRNKRSKKRGSSKKNPKDVVLHKQKYPSFVLDKLSKMCEVLHKAARDDNGNELKPHQINRNTIFVNKEVLNALEDDSLLSDGSPYDSAMLSLLLDAAVSLDITPIRDNLACEIARRLAAKKEFEGFSDLPIIDSNQTDKSNEEGIEEEKLDNSLGNIRHLGKRELEEITHFYITKNQQYIKEYFQMFKEGIKHHFTFADYIGLYGQSEWKHGEIHLPNRGITSFEGMELIRNINRITEIDLSDNNILNFMEDDKLNRIFSHLTQVKCLNVSNNRLKYLPDAIFAHNELLEELNLEDNQLSHLPDSVYRLGKLKKYSNFINGNSLPESEIEEIKKKLSLNTKQGTKKHRKK